MNSTTFSGGDHDPSSTDVSSSLSILSTTLANETNPEHARTMIEKQQLIHQCEMMKIEIAQKHQNILDLKAQHDARMEEVEEQLHTAKHNNQLLQFKLNSALEQHSKELKSTQDANSNQILTLRRKQAEIECLLPSLQVKSAEIRNLLLNMHVSVQQYNVLVAKPREELSIKELIQVSFYEHQIPANKRIDELRTKIDTITEQYELTRKEVKLLEANVTVEKQGRVELEAENANLRQKIELLSNQLDPGHKMNYKNILAKNKELESVNKQLLTSNTYLKAEVSALSEEQKKTDTTHSALRQECALLNQDKEYMSRSNAELTSRAHRAEERLDAVMVELDNAKRARDQVFQELVNVRQSVTADQEHKMQAELDLLKQKTGSEINQLRLTAEQVYEREKQILLDSRNSAVTDRNEALRKNRELQDKYNEISESYHTYQSNTSSKISEYENTLKLKDFELERTALLFAEITAKYNESAKENDKMRKKLEVLLEEYNSKKSEYVEEVNTLNTKLRSLQTELGNVKCGDDTVRDIIQVLGSENISCNKEHLARKLVELSRNNDLYKERLESKEKALEKALVSLDEVQSSLHHSNQPASYLVESIRKRDDQIARFKAELVKASESLNKLQQENKALLADKEVLALDLERALKNREKLSDLKSMFERKLGMTEKCQPAPTIFTK